MRDEEAPPDLDDIEGEGPKRGGGAHPLIGGLLIGLVALASLAMVFSTDRVARVGQPGRAALNAADTVVETVRYVARKEMVRNKTGGFDYRTPSWMELVNAFNLRDSVAVSQFEAYRKRYPDLMQNADVETPIPEGADLQLPIN